MSPIHSRRVPCSGVKVFIEDSKGRLLILRHANHELTKKPTWGLPGGHIDWSEEPEDALKREIKEELGIDAEIGQPILAWNKPIGKDHKTICIGYRCRVKNGQQFKLGPDDDECHWMAPSELDHYFSKTDREYRPAIARYLQLGR